MRLHADLQRGAATAALIAILLPGAALAGDPEAEREGISPTPVDLPVPDPERHRVAGAMLPTTGLLLIPESTNDRVMAFDPMTGDLVDPDFVPADPTNLSTPIHAILSADGQSILVSDQINDVVQQYALDGAYIGVFAPAGGPNTAILDNIRGIALRPNGNLLVSVGGGANANAIAEFDTAGNSLGNFVPPLGGGLDSPFDIYEVVVTAGSLTAGDFLSGGIDSDAVHHYDAAGAALANLAAIDTFPEQVFQIGNGNVLVANFIGTQEGVVEYDPTGAVVGVYDPAGVGGNRGVYELPNGNILTTNGSGVFEIDRLGNLVDTKISGVGARFIEFVGGEPEPPPPQPVIEVPVLSPLGLALLVLLLLGAAFLALRPRAA
jgi:hypothetical protein